MTDTAAAATASSRLPEVCCTCGRRIPPGQPHRQLTAPPNALRTWTARFTLHATTAECTGAAR